jgi:hypothetical protein
MTGSEPTPPAFPGTNTGIARRRSSQQLHRPLARPGHGLASGLVALALCWSALLWSAPSTAAVLAGWDVHSLAGGAGNFGPSPMAPTTTDPNLTVGGLTRASGVSTSGTAAARGWGGTDWQSSSASAAVSGGDYLTFTVTATSGHQVSFSSVSRFDYRRSSTGPATGTPQYQIGSGSFTDINTLSYSSTSSSGASLAAIDLSGHCRSSECTWRHYCHFPHCQLRRNQ